MQQRAIYGRLTKTFNRFDRDLDGRVNKLEIRLLSSELGEPLEDDELLEFHSMLDSIGGTMNFAQFQRWWTERSSKRFHEQKEKESTMPERYRISEICDTFKEMLDEQNDKADRRKIKQVLDKTRNRLMEFRMQNPPPFETDQIIARTRRVTRLPTPDPELKKMLEECVRRLHDRQLLHRKMNKAMQAAEKRKYTDEAIRGEAAAKEAQQRIERSKRAEIEKMEKEVERLIKRQTSSLEAMSVARLLSPRFEQAERFKPLVSKNMNKRLEVIMQSDRVGSFYS
eukprot:GILJ01003291.1.p1 GENE.GILJ01003291.1~~GILJ01003291.1.p1  ORF type:complete len:283 (+),score=45.10 GILJ01003291.1:123-971(+)